MVGKAPIYLNHLKCLSGSNINGATLFLFYKNYITQDLILVISTIGLNKPSNILK